jgi:chromosome partitioning protein
MRQCKIITIAALKGGTGKTTTARNLGHALHGVGRRVLLVDLDQQANLTLSAGISAPIAPLSEIMAAVIDGAELSGGFIEAIDGADIIPGHKNLAVTEINLRGETGGERVLAEILEPLRSRYDYILIDTAPSIGMLTINALAACDSVIVPVSPELWSAAGLTELLNTIGKTKRRINPRISVEGVLLTMCEPGTILFREVRDMLDEFCAGKLRVFDTAIPRTTKVGRANFYSVPIAEFDPKCRAAAAYAELAKEVTGCAADQTEASA